MPQFNFDIVRIGYGLVSVTVEAEDEKAARLNAMEEAGDCYFSERISDYYLEDETPVELAPARFESIKNGVRRLYNCMFADEYADAQEQASEGSSVRTCVLGYLVGLIIDLDGYIEIEDVKYHSFDAFADAFDAQFMPKEAWCETCDMDMEYDEHGNCTGCGANIFEVPGVTLPAAE